MRHILKFTFLLFAGSILFTSCKKDNTIAPDEISSETLAQIYNHGFGTNNVQKVEEGYLVEGDIVLTPEFLAQAPGGHFLRIANNEQYRTTNLVNGPRTITLSMDSKLRNKAGYSSALQMVADRYNAQNLSLNFSVVNSNGNIRFSNLTGPYLASAGFPSGGQPYGSVKVNANAIGTGTSPTFINYLATILSHEVGHCIGFRHTDFMNRQFSCGGAFSNEGQSSSGAIHIPGTPTAADPDSWMLACIGNLVNRPFNANDATALDFLY